MGRRTPLHALHARLGARIVDFGGWDMPVNYGSQIEEHHAVRRHAGVFDVSHMCVVDLTGERTREFLQYLLANDVGKLTATGKALYSCLLDDEAGVLDDLIVYFLASDFYRLVVNAGTRDKDLAWIRSHAAKFDVAVRERDDLAMLAVQGPATREIVATLVSPQARDAVMALGAFFGADAGEWFVARTGYTGEDGFEIMLPAAGAERLWNDLMARGVKPCGLGARDTLRLEAGMNLYGNDMSEATHPLESGLGWTIAWEPASRDFVGRRALERIKAGGVASKLVGLVLEDRGVLRSHQKVVVPSTAPAQRAAEGAAQGLAEGAAEGEVTSGTFSPTLEKSIALARVPVSVTDRVQVDVRGRLLDARVVRPPFVRFGKSLIGVQS